jgi:hypothetical protein
MNHQELFVAVDWQLLAWGSQAAGADAVCPVVLDWKHACKPNIATPSTAARIIVLRIVMCTFIPSCALQKADTKTFVSLSHSSVLRRTRPAEGELLGRDDPGNIALSDARSDHNARW